MTAAVAESKTLAKQLRRALQFLHRGRATVKQAANRETVILSAHDGAAIAVPVQVCRSLVSAGLAERHGCQLVLLPQGRSRLLREKTVADGFVEQHADIEFRQINAPDGRQRVAVNMSESPLARLSKLKTRSGERFLEDRERRAGERLRSDFTRAQMQPSLGMAWQEPVGKSSSYGAGGRIELTETAVCARQRVEAALHAVGPELSGILIDVCCLLKGLAIVEHERGWPVRSAKIVLKTALSALARHYEPRANDKAGESTIRHWGDQGYRPSLGGITEIG